MNFPGRKGFYPEGDHLRRPMVLWIGVDDTDSLRGMCTTFLATEFVRELTKDLDLIGYPRLVRLNPNIPWKTRGNGAVAMCVGTGLGEPLPIGEVGGHPIVAYPRGTPDGDPRSVVDRLAELVERWADLESPGTDPGLVVLSRKPRASLYWEAVRGIVARSRAEAAIRGHGISRTWKSGRGLIGASAACAWRPRDRTWEVLAYRDHHRWGTPRDVSPASVRNMDRAFPSTFNNYDYENDHVVIAPSTPCPVLFGIRGDRPTDLPAAFGMIREERAERWMIFESNQGTDDHVQPQATAMPRSAGRFRDAVTRPPRTLPGGHVVFGLGAVDVTAYEPSKQFRRIVRALVEGDRVEVVGSLRETPRTVNLEKLRVISLQEVQTKVANPTCASCGLRMKSMGHAAGFRCRRCGARGSASSAVMQTVTRPLARTWYEPPVSARRHLSKPLKRMATA